MGAAYFYIIAILAPFTVGSLIELFFDYFAFTGWRW